jgi:hypothetical protein
MGVRVPLKLRQPDCAPITVCEHLAVPETNYPIAFCFEVRGSSLVRFSAVLAAIDFDHKLKAVAGEACDEMAQRNLETKSRFKEGLKQASHRLFRLGRLAAQLSGASDRDGRRVLFHKGRCNRELTPIQLRPGRSAAKGLRILPPSRGKRWAFLPVDGGGMLELGA